MDELIIVNPPPAKYTPEDHGSLIVYLRSFPTQSYAVARNLGYTGLPPTERVPDGSEHQTLDEWYTALAFQFWLASQPRSKKSGSKDAVIFLEHSFPQIPTLGDLVTELAEEVGKSGY
jgi:hypothetical protein